MFFHEALAVLGIDEETSRDNARRAYLRLLKQHKPEHDPEGFKRVREAYDLVRELLPESEPTRDEPEHREEPVHGADFRVEASEPPPSSHRGPPPSSSPSRQEVEELVEREPAASARAGLSVEPEPEADSIPDWATLYQRADAAEETSEWPVVYAALELAARHVDAPEPPITAALRMMLRCVRDDEREGYERLHAALTQWAAATGMETRAFRGERVVLWTVIRELRDVAGRLPGRVARPIAAAALEGMLERARNQLQAYALVHPDDAIVAATVLFEHAPYLHRTIGPMLHGAARGRFMATPTPSGSDVGWRALFPIIAVVLFAMRFCLKTDTTPSTRFDPATFHFTAPPPIPSLILPDLDPPALTWARMLRDDTFNLAEPALRWASSDLVVKIQSGDCARSREAFAKYVQLLDGSGASKLDHRRVYTQRLDEALKEWCAESADASVGDAPGADH